MSRRPDPYNDETRPAGAKHNGPASSGWSLWVLGEGVSRLHALPPSGDVTIGRAPDCDVQLPPDARISRRHAVLVLGDAPTLRDLGGTNGVTVRGSKVAAKGSIGIAPGDAIEIGPVTLLLQVGREHEGESHVPKTIEPAKRPAPNDPVVVDTAMLRLHKLAARVADSPVSVLILGETGTGKEILATRIHQWSSRSTGPMVRVNCAAIAQNLIESELFGHERGAFTGADQARVGLIESADGGTLLLDEVGEIPLSVQAKLLRVLEEREVLRVGSVRPRGVDVRFVAATHRDLRADASSGAFRADLYYRLNGITLTIPPLRERPDEIEPLARFFLGRAKAPTRGSPTLSPAALNALRAYTWPGNVRELRNAVERAMLLADAVIEVTHLPPEIASGAPADVASASPPSAPRIERAEPTREQLREQLDSLERDRILDALNRCGGNQTRAAELLGIPRRTFVSKLASYGIARPRNGRQP